MGKLTTKYPAAEVKGRRKNSSLKVKYTQENERLLEEFLTAREELKAQFEKEKGEIISNYERRNKYLRNLLEEYSEKIDMLKLNLEAEKEENKILQEKFDVMLNDKNSDKKNAAPNNNNNHNSNNSNNNNNNNNNSNHNNSNRDINTMNAVLFLDHYKSGTLNSKDGESKITSYIPHSSSETSDLDCRSDVSSIRKHSHHDSNSIRKHSDSRSDVSSTISKHFSSTTTISKYSDTSSLRSESTTPTPCMPPTTYIGIHATCREEFARLLEEIKAQKAKHEDQMGAQKRSMRIEFERERLQIEQCVFKQLNNKLEKEFKRRELLMNERSCLHHCLSSTLIEATLNHTTNTNTKKLIPYDTTWAETNSDSGADVGDNRSDDDDAVGGEEDAAAVHVRDLRSEKSTNTCNNFINDLLCNTVIGDILREQKKRLTNEFQRQFDVEKSQWKTMSASLNANIANLVNENDWLKKQVAYSGNFFDDLSSFQSDIKQKLASLKYLLDEDPYAC